MDIRPIETEADHRAALKEIEALRGAKEGTPEGDRLNGLATLVHAYDDAHGPIAARQRKAARRLARLGGSDPNATAAPRRRYR